MKSASFLIGAVLMASGLVAATPRPAPRPAVASTNWLKTFAATPQGGFRVGNPNAKVKLIEYGSLSCPHCRAFHAESNAVLNSKYIATGQVSLEFRPFVLNGPDFVATVAARCGNDPRASLQRIDALYDNQAEWLQPFMEQGPDVQAKVQAAPDAQRALVLAQIGGLDQFMARHGMPAQQFAQCLTSKAALDHEEALQEEASLRQKVDSTPTFFINGTKDGGSPTWASLEPRIVQALR